MSHPMWVRGLKPRSRKVIEDVVKVAPYVGAWIETTCMYKNIISRKSHPMWVRGLKRPAEVQNYIARTSHPMWVRGLKQNLSAG